MSIIWIPKLAIFPNEHNPDSQKLFSQMSIIRTPKLAIFPDEHNPDSQISYFPQWA